ncbi:MAG TPA: TRAP transporter substrate-binding protein DctP [Alphaproteobacteria bacterium]
MTCRRPMAVLAGALALGLAAAGGAAAEQLKYNLFQPPRTLEGQVLQSAFAELEKETKGTLTFKLFAGGQLLSGPGTLKGIQDGVVDAGFIVPSLNLGELKHIAIIPDLLPWALNSHAATAAAMETILLDCPACLKEQADHNIWFLGGEGPTSWNIMCTKPVADLAEFQGRRVRVTGSSATRMIRALGGVAVQLSPPEIGPALSGGQIDCAVGPNAWLADYSLWDSVKQVIALELGVYHGLGLFVTNRDSLARMTPEQKKAYLDLSLKYAVVATDRYADQQREVREMAKKRGIQIWTPTKDFDAALAKFRDSDLANVVSDFKARGATDVQQVVDTHLDNLKKWDAIVAKVGDDRAALIKAMNEEIYSKLKF